MKSWAASLALHGVAFGVAALFWLEPAAEPAREAMRWEVSFAAAPAPPSQATPEPPRPPRRVETPAPKPPPPPPLPAPREAPATPVPPVPARVEPAVTAQAAPVSAPVPAPAPVAAVASPAPPAADTAAEVERRWYLALLERLRELKRYPMAARRLGQEGVVLVEARIGPDGRLEGAEVKRGSGYPMLDKDALRLLEAAAETARTQLRPERPTRLEIPIAYRLDG